MKEITGNLWDYYDQGDWVVITTNGTIRKDGACVMGKGVALEAKQRFPTFPRHLGKTITLNGNRPYIFEAHRIITLPVKHNWWEVADIKLIEHSILLMVGAVDLYKLGTVSMQQIYMVRPGCGNGQLDWADVKPIIEPHLDERFTIVERE